MNNFMDILQTVLILLVFVIIFLGFIYWYMSYKNKNQDKKNENSSNNSETIKTEKVNTSQYTKLSVFDFMEFDKIEDNMIVQNNGQKYLMAIECEGINYDLMSEVEKTSVEAGFVQFLNTLRHPIQIYTQTRTINIGNSIENYTKKIQDIKEKLDKKQVDYNRMLQSGTYSSKEANKIKIELARIQNLYDYGKDVVENIEKMSLNKNVLRKHYYIIIPYYSSELGNNLLEESEKQQMIFSELYTRAQAITRTLFACSMKCKIMDSYELAELLYVAYNRDESEIYGIDKALKAGYTELYSTAQDVFDKQIEALNNEIEKRALNVAKEQVDEIMMEKQKTIKKKEQSFDELVKEMAEVILKENEKYIGKDIAEEAIKRVKKRN